MPRPHDVSFEFEYDSERRARIVERSVRPEVGEIGSDRSVTTISRNSRTVTIQVEARDLVALRAGMNTWLSLVDTAERCSARAD